MPISRKWVEKILVEHVERLNLPDSPQLGTEAFDDAVTTWKEAFDDGGCQFDDLCKACRRVARQPSPWWRDQLPAVLAAIEALRLSNPGQPAEGQGGGDRAAVMAASAGCDWCFGSGFVPVYRREYEGSPTVQIEQYDGTFRRLPATATLACHCQYGRWILTSVARDDSAAAAKLAGIEAVIAGESKFSGIDPTAVPDDMVPVTTDWRAHVKAWSDSRDAVSRSRARLRRTTIPISRAAS